MKKLSMVIVTGVVGFGVLQLVRPSIPTKSATAEVQVPAAVRRVLEKNCYSCHSDERRLAWFDEIVPGYWLVRHDVLTAREHLNFSTLGSKPPAMQRAMLFEAVNMIQLGAMPLPSFTKLHPEAVVSAEELGVLKAYLAPWGAVPARAAGDSSAAAAVVPASLSGVQPEFNGMAFDATFEGWKMISTTDRGDNNTFRFILGNDVAVKAVREGNMTPWPDGTRMAKIAWQQEMGADELIHPGKFVQVELMVKDAHAYKKTEGWGWGRWRGLDLKPYGKDAGFVTECTSCHLPVRGNDYVYTLPITAAKVNREEVVKNAAAGLPASLPYQPLGWGAITIYVDPKTRTTATLYGNDVAMSGVSARSAASGGENKYGAGAVLALVTWAQRDDPHWFGGRIAHTVQTVEFVQVGADGVKKYSSYDGAGVLKGGVDRSGFMVGLAPARLP
jgi:mono/diheme cytochrome c family protein